MFKKLGLVLAVLAFVFVMFVPQAQAKYGLVKWDYAVIDENGQVITDTVTVNVYTASTNTSATIYADENATAKSNNYTITDGSIVFYSSATTLDILANVGTRGGRLIAVGADDTHRITIPVQTIEMQSSIQFTPNEFMAMNNAESSVVVLSTSSQPTLEYNNKTIAIVWSDGPESYAQVVFKVPTNYSSNGTFRAFTDYNTGSAHPQIMYRVYVNKDGTAWDTATTAQTAVDPNGTAGTPELTDLSIATDFASLAAGDIVTFQIARSDQEAAVTADLELYYVDFFYNAKK